MQQTDKTHRLLQKEGLINEEQVQQIRVVVVGGAIKAKAETGV